MSHKHLNYSLVAHQQAEARHKVRKITVASYHTRTIQFPMNQRCERVNELSHGFALEVSCSHIMRASKDLASVQNTYRGNGITEYWTHYEYRCFCSSIGPLMKAHDIIGLVQDVVEVQQASEENEATESQCPVVPKTQYPSQTRNSLAHSFFQSLFQPCYHLTIIWGG